MHACFRGCTLTVWECGWLPQELSAERGQPVADNVQPSLHLPCFQWPGTRRGPRALAVILVCRCRQGLPSRSESRIARTDRGYYWKISAELNSLVLLLCLSASCAVSTHRIGLAHIHHPLRSARCLDPQVLLVVVPKTHSTLFPVSKQNNRTVTACVCVSKEEYQKGSCSNLLQARFVSHPCPADFNPQCVFPILRKANNM
jgi:hypothetical protein